MGLIMDYVTLSDQLHRLAKLTMDTGEAETVEQATQILSRYRLAVAVGPEIACSETLQAALLTIVNAGRRCFLGGVYVAGNLNVPLRVRWLDYETVEAAVVDLQGKLELQVPAEIPLVILGTFPEVGVDREFVVRATFNGWVGGVTPLADDQRLAEDQEFSPSGVLAGGLAVAEAFQYLRGDTLLAGRRSAGLSLWQPDASQDWLKAQPGPAVQYLPSRLWLIGLGHLGQAYLWTLGLLPYASPNDVEFVLQDFDTLMVANESTSLLTSRPLLGQKKTRAMAEWCERRGFREAIVERAFGPNFSLGESEPRLALCGVDNPETRRALEEVGFAKVVDAGLGAGSTEYLSFQLHTFPASRLARQIWGRPIHAASTKSLLRQPAYQALANQQVLDECGLVNLAGRTVGAPFVGAVTAALTIAEVLRPLHGGLSYEVIDGDLRSLDSFAAYPNGRAGRAFNPGVTGVTPGSGLI
jgi:hypothetical protein